MPTRNIRMYLALCIMLVPAVSRAQRDIVCSARYYTPPSSRAVSYWHLYRIKPDGTGREQLTRGAYHHLAPVWSPDGSRLYVAFQKGGDRIIATRDGKETPVSARLINPIWLTNRSLAGRLPSDKQGEAPRLQIIGVDGEAQRVVPLKLAAPPDPQEEPFARGIAGLMPVPGRDLGPYGKRPDGTERAVWVAPLQVGNTKTGKLRVISKGTVWVLEADWR
jgi:hypothetical protein